MKVLILSMTCGEGHNAVARALSAKFTRCNDEVKVVDIYRSNKRLLNLNNKGFLFCKRFIPHIYESIWLRYKKRDSKKRDTAPIHKYVKKIRNDVFSEISLFNPDAIICTHYYAGCLVSEYKKEFSTKAKTFSILTDFLPHPFWETNVLVDYVLSPNEFSRKDLINKGFSDKQIKVLGFPIHEKYFSGKTKDDARKELGLKKEKFVVLLTNGGGGSSSTFGLLKKLCSTFPNVQFINVCGHDEKLQSKIDKYIIKHNVLNLINYGFSNNVETLMKASDVTICKAGCAMLSEAIVSNIPMIIKGQMTLNERENKQLLINSGASLGFENKKQMISAVQRLKDNPNELNRIKKNQESLSYPNATNNIVDFVRTTVKGE